MPENRGRVGVGYFKQPLFSPRDGRVENDSYMQPYSGLREVAARIDRGSYSVNPMYVGGDSEIDHLLISMISFYDFYNLRNEIPATRQYQVIVGGPACHNIRSVLDQIDVAVFGRCDGDTINRILSGEHLPNVWRKSEDPMFEGGYTVGAADLTADQRGLFGPVHTEKSVGCPVGCSFCFYSHWNKFVSSSTGNRYSSGTAPYEDFFTRLDWKRCARGGVTALDGVDEQTRRRVNKRISYKQIVEKLLSINDSDYHGLHRAKVYIMYGYPWESPGLALDLIAACREVDRRINRKLLFRLQCSHFIPFPKTPMELSAFNPSNFRDNAAEWAFEGDNIRVAPGFTNQSPRLSALSAFLNRYDGKHPDWGALFFTRRFWKSSWKTVEETYRSWGLFEPIDRHPLDNVSSGSAGVDRHQVNETQDLLTGKGDPK